MVAVDANGRDTEAVDGTSNPRQGHVRIVSQSQANSSFQVPTVTFDDNRRRIERQLECDPATFTRDWGAFGLGGLVVGRCLTAPVVGGAE